MTRQSSKIPDAVGMPTSQNQAAEGVVRTRVAPRIFADLAGAPLPADVLLSIVDYFRRTVTRKVNPNGDIVEETTFVDRQTGRRVGSEERVYGPAGTLKRFSRNWRDQNGLTDHNVVEIYEDGRLKLRYRSNWRGGVPCETITDDYADGEWVRRTTEEFDRNLRLVKRIVEAMSGGKVTKRSEYDGEGRPEGSVEFGWDGEGRLIRTTERDQDGTLARTTVIAFLLDGSYSITVTDFSTTPATVTRAEYHADGTPR